LEQNEPGLSSGLAVLRGLLDDAADAGIKTDRVVLFGFSQGACLSLEFAARHAQRFGGIVGLSGGLIGPSGTPRAYGGSLAGTPVFLGCSDVDPHIPRARVLETADVLGELGADVTERIYPGMGHTVNRDELDAVRVMLHGIAGMART
jgi:predicted esterase